MVVLDHWRQEEHGLKIFKKLREEEHLELTKNSGLHTSTHDRLAHVLLCNPLSVADVGCQVLDAA